MMPIGATPAAPPPCSCALPWRPRIGSGGVQCWGISCRESSVVQECSKRTRRVLCPFTLGAGAFHPQSRRRVRRGREYVRSVEKGRLDAWCSGTESWPNPRGRREEARRLVCLAAASCDSAAGTMSQSLVFDSVHRAPEAAPSWCGVPLPWLTAIGPRASSPPRPSLARAVHSYA